MNVFFNPSSNLDGSKALRLLVLLTLAYRVWDLPVNAVAQLPQTRLDAIYPPGGKIGNDVEVTISGELSEAATRLIFSHPGITATQRRDPPSEYRVARRRPKSFLVRIAPDVPPGSYEVRAVGPTGLSNPRLFMVGELDEKQFRAEGNGPDTPFDLAVGEVVSCRARPDKRDYYRFAAKGRQTVLVQVWAQRIDSRLDAALAIYDSQGKRRARAVQAKTRDPVLAFTPPAEGDYLIEVRDITYRGGDEYPYRLEVSQRPHVEAVFPPLARNGEPASFTLYGFNLPQGVSVPESAPLGNLQALTLRFQPRFEKTVSIAEALPGPKVAGALIDGAALRLPAPLNQANPVFLTRATGPVITERPDNNSPEQAQPVDVPCEIAGQFHPRRDVDWFEFDAKKGQTVWMELASQRLGTVADPTLRVRMKKKTEDGKVEFRDLATTDDIEGPPRSRDARRFYSGTGDVSYRLNAKEDATYQIAVRDLYNASHDDPRLIYSLTIRPQRPNFQLIAFANPARHDDEKIVKPEAVSLLPGGTAAIRVRLLPQHGFNAPVEITAEALPAGVSASPLTLNSRTREGLLVLSAARRAKPVAGSIRIAGRTTLGDRTIERIARTGTIRRGTANVNNEATDVRLTRDLAVAVIDSRPSPAQVRPEQVVNSIGGKFTVPLHIDRREGFEAELQLDGAEVPNGIKVETVKTTGSTAQLALVLEDKGLPPGKYTFPLTGKVKEKRPRDPNRVKEAEADLAKINDVLAKLDQSSETLAAKRKEAEDLVALAQQMVEGARAQQEPARRRLAEKLAAEQKAVARLAEKLAAAAADIEDQAWREEVAQTEATIATLRQERIMGMADLKAASEPLALAMQALEQRRALLAAAKQEREKQDEKREEAEKQRQEAEKRLAELKKSQLEQDHEFWIYSLPVQLEVRPTPVELLLAETPYSIKAGTELAIPIRVRRHFGFAGQITVDVSVPGESGIRATPIVLGPGTSTATLVLTAPDNAKVRSWNAKIQAALNFNGIDITQNESCRIQLVASPP